MPTWEALELTEPPESERHLRGWFIEVPRGGGTGEDYTRGDLYTMDVKGWVIGREARATAVEIVYHDHVIRTDPVRGARPDIVPAFPELLQLEHPDLLGVCLSGSGPSVLALCTGAEEVIAASVGAVYDRIGVPCVIRTLSAHQPEMRL